ncbi:hypothetical protein FDECE_5311 [Fusarium decemcellulare]|nr:hypothetical protein FDECE_5311 [Fusarium decemcellulare]
MERLPTEILFSIVSRVQDDISSDEEESDRQITLAPLACISRRWQHPVESHTFRHLFLTPKRLEQAELANHFTPARLSYIHSVYFDFIFPDDNFFAQSLFDRVLQPVLGLLAQLPYRPEPCVKFTLHLPEYRESNLSWYENGCVYYPDESSGLVVGYNRTPCTSHPPSTWEVEIPEMPMISEFVVDFETHCLVFEPRSMNQLAGKMSRLEKVQWCLSDNEKDDLEEREELRNDFADTLDLIPRSVKSFRLRYLRRRPSDDRFLPESIVPSDANGDILSQVLYRFTQRDGLLKAYIEGSFDETIIWPGRQRTLPHWPTLQKLYVHFHEVLPSGEWLMERDDQVPVPHYTVEDPRAIPGEEFDFTFRCEIDAAVMDRLLLAAAQGVHHMPEMTWIGFGFGFDRFPAIILFTEMNETRGQFRLSQDTEWYKVGQEALGDWREAAKIHSNKFDRYPYYTSQELGHHHRINAVQWFSEPGW